MGAEERVWWGIRGVLELVDGMVLEIWGLRGTVGVLFERGEVDTGAGGAFFFSPVERQLCREKCEIDDCYKNMVRDSGKSSRDSRRLLPTLPIFGQL